MASLPIKPLDGPGGYLRWKESVLLRAHTLGVARVLFEDRPSGEGDDAVAQAAAAAAKTKWERDDAVCRGHILATLSDRLFPDYARFATAAELWRALARTYDVADSSRHARQDEFYAFALDQGASGRALLEQIAHAEALGAAAGLPDDLVAHGVSQKLPEQMYLGFVSRQPGRHGEEEKGMSLVWEIARRVAASGLGPEVIWNTTAMDDGDDQGSGGGGLRYDHF